MNKPPYITIGEDVYRLVVFRVVSRHPNGGVDRLQALVDGSTIELSPEGSDFIISYVLVTKRPMEEVFPPLLPYTSN